MRHGCPCASTLQGFKVFVRGGGAGLRSLARQENTALAFDPVTVAASQYHAWSHHDAVRLHHVFSDISTHLDQRGFK